MKILLLSTVRTGNFWYPQLGLAYIASYCRKDFQEITLLDCAKQGYTFLDFEGYLKSHIFDVIGITVFAFTAREVLQSIEIIRKVRPSTTIVLGGHFISAQPEKTFQYYSKADFGIAGDGEIPFLELLHSLKEKKSYKDIPGLIYKADNNVKMNSPVFIEDIDALGFPAWDLIPPPEYFKVFSHKKRSAAIVLSRGCPFRCTFCAANLTGGGTFRFRSIPHIVKEIQFLQKNFKIDTLMVQTEGLGSKKSFMKEFCEAIIKNKIKIKIGIPAGIRLSMLDDETLALMRKANFDKMQTTAPESGSDRILKLMNKGLNTSTIKEKIALMNKHGFKPTGNFIIGYPTETREEILQTIDFSLKLKIHQAAYHPFIPIPGAAITNFLIKKGELKENFDFMNLTTMDNVSYAPEGLTIQEISQLQKQAILKFFLRPKIILFLLLDRDRFLFAFHKFMEILLGYSKQIFDSVFCIRKKCKAHE